jgi:hypothetical protein
MMMMKLQKMRILDHLLSTKNKESLKIKMKMDRFPQRAQRE